jgi:hypothetical protein
MTRVVVAAPLLLAALGCGGGNTLGGDASMPVEAGGTVPTSCELATQAGCAADQQCQPFCQSQQLVVACRPDPVGAPAIGQPCMTLPCARGGACMAVTNMAATCKKLCAATTDCDAGQACRVVITTYPCATTGPTSVHIKACL